MASKIRCVPEVVALRESGKQDLYWRISTRQTLQSPFSSGSWTLIAYGNLWSDISLAQVRQLAPSSPTRRPVITPVPPWPPSGWALTTNTGRPPVRPLIFLHSIFLLFLSERRPWQRLSIGQELPRSNVFDFQLLQDGHSSSPLILVVPLDYHQPFARATSLSPVIS